MVALVAEGLETRFWTVINPRRPEGDIGMGSL